MPKSDAWPPFFFGENSAWGKCFTDFLRQKYEHSNSPYTLADYRLILTRFFSEPSKMPDTYTREDVIAFMHAPGQGKGRIGQPPSPGTRNGRLSVLSSFYAYAGGYSTLSSDGNRQPLMNRMSPTSGLSQVQSPRKYRSIRFTDFEKLFSVIPTDTVIGLKYRAVYLCIFWTARRVREITELRWGDLEQTQLVETDGTSRIGYQYKFRNKGSKAEIDMAELPQPAYDALDAYLTASGRKAHMQADDPLFVADPHYLKLNSHHDLKKPITAQVVWYQLKQYAIKAGIDPKSITTHSLRHASAQFRYQAGEDIVSISHLLRHRSVGTTSLYLQGLVSQTDDGAKLLTEQFARFSKPKDE